MQKIVISCPGCKKSFNLSAENIGSLVNRNFTCKSCGFTASFRLVLPKHIVAKSMQQASLETHIGGASSVPPPPPVPTSGKAPNETRVSVHQPLHIPHLLVKSSQQDFPLQPGEYIIGRNSSDSKATLKLAPDPYMSREHAKLVVRVENGQTIIGITGLKANNPIIVGQGKILPHGKMFKVQNGNVMKLGNTIIQFVF